MSQLAHSLPANADDTDESAPVLSLAEVRRLLTAASVAGKRPADFLHDSVMAAVEETLAVEAAEAEGDTSASWDTRIGELSSAIRAMLEPLDEIAAVAGTEPVRIELTEDERLRFTEVLLDPPEPNEALKAAHRDYQATLAAIRARRSRG